MTCVMVYSIVYSIYNGVILILFFLLSALDDENPSADYNRCYLTIIHTYINNTTAI